MATSISDAKKTRVLVIGGFDPSGGAGIQIDLATLSQIGPPARSGRAGVFAYSAISAITIQDSLSVKKIYPVSAAALKEQIETVLEDSAQPISVVKIGMLASAENVKVVADLLKKNRFKAVVLDSVIKPTKGAALLPSDALPVLIERLVPLTTIITPNLFEAEAISGTKKIRKAAEIIHKLGAEWVLVKGGHAGGPANDPADRDKIVDILYNGKQFFEFSQPRVQGRDVRGTGCILASALAAYLAQGCAVLEATDLARKFVIKKIKQAKKLGKGRPQAI